MPRVPRPLFYWPDLELVIQPAVTAAPLTAHALEASRPADARARWMRSAGSGLAALHGTVTASGPRRRLQDDARELQGFETLFSRLAPDLARRFDDAVAAVCQHALAGPEPTAAASHGAFRTDQLLVDGDRGLVLIDLDSFCWATPGRDMGNLLAYLDWRAIRRPEDSALVDRARSAFLEGYAAIAPLPGSSWLAAFRAASMLKIAGRRLRSLSIEEWKLLSKLLDAAWETLPA
jgi:Ser/Thr protein kinase RdoA (MazF antagonist)